VLNGDILPFELGRVSFPRNFVFQEVGYNLN
jgi:hypothetical protein